MPALRALTTKIAGLAAGAALLGCGDSEEQPSSPPLTVERSQGVEVVGGDYFFEPDSVVVEGGGGPLEITLDNEGSLAHNLRIFDGEEELGGTPTFPGGEVRSGEVDLEPGTYSMVCTVADHEALGMVGELEVP